MQERSRPQVEKKQVPKTELSLSPLGSKVSAFSHVRMSRYVNLWSLHLFASTYPFSLSPFSPFSPFLPSSGPVPFCVSKITNTSGCKSFAATKRYKKNIIDIGRIIISRVVQREAFSERFLNLKKAQGTLKVRT